MLGIILLLCMTQNIPLHVIFICPATFSDKIQKLLAMCCPKVGQTMWFQVGKILKWSVDSQNPWIVRGFSLDAGFVSKHGLGCMSAVQAICMALGSKMRMNDCRGVIGNYCCFVSISSNELKWTYPESYWLSINKAKQKQKNIWFIFLPLGRKHCPNEWHYILDGWCS